MPNPAELMQIGQKLVELNNQDKGREAVNTLYSQDAISAEAIAMEGQASNEVKGMDAILGKHDWWESQNEVHSATAEGPFAHGEDRFCVIFEMDVTDKTTNERTQMREVATYYVNDDGKIYREEFAYALG
jgi:hypothetical protein